MDSIIQANEDNLPGKSSENFSLKQNRRTILEIHLRICMLIFQIRCFFWYFAETSHRTVRDFSVTDYFAFLPQETIEDSDESISLNRGSLTVKPEQHHSRMTKRPPVQKALQESEKRRVVSECHKPVLQRIFDLWMRGKGTSLGYLKGVILTTIYR